MRNLRFIFWLAVLIAYPCSMLAQSSGPTPPPPPTCSQSIAGQLYTNTGTSPATVYTCSYYNLTWQWVVNPSYGGVLYYPTLPSTCSGALPVFLSGWPTTTMYLCVSGFPEPLTGGGAVSSLTTTGTSGAATLASGVLNIPQYQGSLTLTTTGSSGPATLSGNTLNIPQYSGGGTPGGADTQVQYNNSGAFGANAYFFVNKATGDLSANSFTAGTDSSGVAGELDLGAGTAPSTTPLTSTHQHIASISITGWQEKDFSTAPPDSTHVYYTCVFTDSTHCTDTWATGGGGGSGTVNSGTIYSPTYYASTGTAVSGTTPFTGFEYFPGSAAPQAATAANVATLLAGLTGCTTANYFYSPGSGNCQAAGAGTVTSVAMTVPSWLTVAGSPVTSSGTLAVTATTGETANEFLATPNGSSGALALRTIVGADFGSLTGCGTSGYVFTPADNDCIAASGTSAFSSLTSGTNTAAAMVVGSGASLAPTGTGTIQATNIASTISAGTNVTITGSGTTGSPYSISASGSGGSGLTDRPISGTTDTLTSSQNNTANRYTSSSSVAIAVNSPSSLGAGWSAMLWQQGTGNNTFTPASGLINGNSTLAFTQQGQRALMWLDSDGTDYDAALGSGVVTPGTGLSATYTAQGMTLNATGSGTVNTGTAGHIGYYVGTGTAISGNPHLDDGATTAGTVTSSEPVNVSGAIATTPIAEAAAPTGVDTDSGGSVPASTANQSTLTCTDVSGKYTTMGKNPSGSVTSAGGSSVIVWTFSIPTGCGTAYLWMRNSGNFAYYSVVTGTSFTQTAAATTYTPASSYPVGGAYPVNNTTGSVSVAGGALTFLGGPSGGSHIDSVGGYSIRMGWSGYTFGVAANTTDSAAPMMAVTTTKFVSQGAGQFSWAPSTNLGVGTDTSLCRNAAGVVGVGSGSTCGSNGGLTSAVTIAGGTKFTTSGCSISSTTGGASAGVFTLGANSCTAVVTMNGATGWTAPNGWTCQAHDRTAPTVLIGGESSSTTTTASFTIPAGAGATDVISFSCTAY